MIRCRCAECGERYRLDDRRAGQRFRCRECGAVVRAGGSRSAAAERFELDEGEGGGSAVLIMGLVLGGAVLAALLIVGLVSLADGDAEATDVAASDASSSTPVPTSSDPPSLRPTPTPRPPTPRPRPTPRPPRTPPATPESTPAPAMQPGGSGPFGGSDDAPVRGWTVPVDPPPADLGFDPAAEIEVNLPLPRASSGRDLLFPRPGSPFVAVGRNSSPTDQRVIYDLRSGEAIGAVSNLESVHRAAISADGRMFAGYSSSPRQAKGLYLVEATEGRLLGTIPLEHQPTVVAFAGTERLVAIRSDDLTVWKMPEGTPLFTTELADSVREDEFDFSPGGRYMAYADDSHDGRGIVVVDLDTGKEVGVRPIHGPNPRVEGLAFSPDGEELAAVVQFTSTSKLLCWAVADGSQAAHLVFDERFSSLGGREMGPPIQWFPNRQGWFLKGQAVVDRAVEDVVWVVPPEATSREPRLVLDDTMMMAVARKGAASALLAAPIPREDIERAAETVAAGGKPADAGLPPLTRVDWSGLRTVTPTGGTLRVEPDPVEVSGEVKSPIVLERRTTSFELSVAPAAGLVVSYELERRPQPLTVVDVHEARTGERKTSIEVPYECKFGDVSPSGKLVLLRSDRDGDRFDVYSVESGEHVFGWRPLDGVPGDDKGSRGARSEIQQTAFLDDEHLIAVGREDAILWKLPECRPVYRLTDPGELTLSPGRRYLVVRRGSSLNFLEALSGNGAGSILAEGTIRGVSFHPDGTAIGAFLWDHGYTSFVRWRFPSGELDRNFPVRSGRSFEWCGNQYVLANDGTLLDVENQMAVWKYLTSPGRLAGALGRHTLFYVDDLRNRQRLLLAAEIPEPVVAKHLERKLNPLSQFALKPGSAVRLTFNLPAPPDQPDFPKTIRNQIEASLRANKLQVRDDAPITLKVSASRGSGESQTYEVRPLFGPGSFKRETVTVQGEHIRSQVAVELGGDVLWERSSVASNTAFGSGILDEGETVRDVTQRRMWGSYESFWKSASIPQYVFGPQAGYGFGVSKLTLQGAVPTNLSPVPKRAPSRPR